MVDGVSFNPFTGKDFTIDEINYLDTDKNGTISAEELNAGLSWLQSKDTDAELTFKIIQSFLKVPRNFLTGQKVKVQQILRQTRLN